MRRRHPPPTRWMMTDERLGDRLLPMVRALPRGSGVVFRHHATDAAERRRLFLILRRIAAARGLILVAALPLPGRADGVHGRRARRRAGMPLLTRPVHDVPERIAAERAGADVLFVSPVFATRSHPDARPLGRVRFGLLVRGARAPIVALGGMDARRARSLTGMGITGWAAIDTRMADGPSAPILGA